MDTTTVVILVDGLDPEYLDVCPAPRLEEIAKEGFRRNGRAMLPTVTNVNNVSLITGVYPQCFGPQKPGTTGKKRQPSEQH